MWCVFKLHDCDYLYGLDIVYQGSEGGAEVRGLASHQLMARV